jgi:hypothetical protein
MYNECRHIMPSGKKCHSPALRDKVYCYHHANLHRLSDPASRAAQDLPVPAIEDISGIQIALTQILGALNSPYMDTRRAGLLLYGLNLAATLVSRAAAPSPSESVRDVCNEDNGNLLAPATSVCEPPQDCFQCAEWENCEKTGRVDEDEFEDDDEDESELD